MAPKKHRTYIAALLLMVFPVSVQGAATIPGIIAGFGEVIRPLVGVGLGIGVLVFVWGLVQYITKSGDSAATSEGRQRMVWGVIGLFMIVSIWSIVALLQQTLGSGATNTCPPPQIGADTVTDCF